MKKVALIFALFVLMLTVPENNSASAGATCTGATPCSACKNCKYCGHCAKEGGKCGVCKPRT